MKDEHSVPFAESGAGPANPEMEEAVLAALLAAPERYEAVAALLSAEDFADPALGRLFVFIGRLLARGETVQPMTLKTALESEGLLEALGGTQLLAALQASGQPSRALDFARQVQDLSLRRRALAASRALAAELAHVDFLRDGAAILSEHIDRMALLALNRRSGAVGGLKQAARSLMAEIARMAEGDPGGVETGLAALDRLLGPLRPGRLVVLGARPGMGKTALAEGIAWHLAAAGQPVLFLSFEMSGEELLLRQAARESGLPLAQLQGGRLGRAAQERLRASVEALSGRLLLLDDRCPPSLAAAIGRARHHQRRLQRKGESLALVILDYLQLLGGDPVRRPGGSRNEAIAGMTRQAKQDLARGLEVPVLLLSQLNRAGETRDNRRPQLTDLRDSGAIEQDADAVLFIHREQYFLEREEPSRRSGERTEAFQARWDAWRQALLASMGRAELLLQKNRGGPMGSALVAWDGPAMRFADLGAEG